jgi:hypothetical protein
VSDKTPGQANYEGYLTALPYPDGSSWDDLTDELKAALEAGAKAAIAARLAASGSLAALADKWEDESYGAGGGYGDALQECANELRKHEGLEHY